MSTDLIIRPVLPGDIESCYQIEISSFEPSEAATKEKITKRAQEYAEGFLVAEKDGRPVGQINCGATNQLNLADEDFKDMVGHSPDGKQVAVFSLAVAPLYRRQGIAKALLKEFIQRMKAAGKSAILLLCKTELIVFYQQFGFQNRGLSKSRHGGFEWYEMQLIL